MERATQIVRPNLPILLGFSRSPRIGDEVSSAVF